MSEQLSFPGLLAEPPVLPEPQALLPALIHYPHVPSAVRCGHAKAIGKAGERLVDSLLLRWGFRSIEADESEAFDRFLPHQEALLRLQIKTVTQAHQGCFSFAMQQGYGPSPQGRRDYAEDAFDLAALVILPANAVAFTARKLPVHRVSAAVIPRLQERPQETLIAALSLLETMAGRPALTGLAL
ncbi:MAG: hypothetical protein CFE34_01820 [Rhodobacteraceae bacterium PARR1]|nr:MAG: hypothetical protein CFE34_01820 [Rhodobacteraceae bacterium PARR1]